MEVIISPLGGEISTSSGAALIHMEMNIPVWLTVADIAACFGKTPVKFSVLHQLIDDGFSPCREDERRRRFRRSELCCQRCLLCERWKRFGVKATARSKTSWPSLTWRDADTRQGGFYLPGFQR
jgi:hypothetical protein